MKNNQSSQTPSFMAQLCRISPTLRCRGEGHSPVRYFAAVLFFLSSFLSLSAQPQDFFYRAWTQTGGAVSPGFINRVVTVAGSGTVSYSASSVLISTNNYGMRLTKYSSSGTTSWIANFDLGAGGTTHVGGIALDASGNVLVTGSAYNGSTNGHDLYLVKYNSSGTKLWHQTYSGTGTGTDAGAAVICNSSGDIFVTGMASQTFPNVDALTLCYASNGTLVWDETWDNASLIDAGATLSLLGTRVFVTGATQTNFNTWEYAVLRYEQSSGSLVSATVTSAGGTNIELVSAATLDAAGNVYLTGALGASGQGFNIKTIKLSPSMAILWTANWNGTANLDDAGRSIAVDTAGNVFVAGYTTASDRDGILLKYSPSGSLLFATGENASGAGEFTGIGLTSAQEPFVGGYTSERGNKDFLALFYSNGGTLRWSEAYNGHSNEDDLAQQVVPDGYDNFLLSGTSGTSTLAVKYKRHALLLPQDEEVNAPFIENRGQVMGTDSTAQDDVRYYTRSNYPNTYIFDDKVSFVFAHIDTIPSSQDTMTRLDMSFLNETSTVAVGLERQEDFHNYYLGHIPEGRERVPLENKVLHPGIYTNIDALYGQGQDGFFARFVCKPGSTPGHIQLLFRGHTDLTVETDGSLRIETDLEDLILAPPTAVFSDAGGTESAAGWSPAFVLQTDSTVRFSVGTVPSGSSLIIKTGRERYDPENDCDYWSTYYGDTGFEINLGSEVDENGFMYFTGKTYSALFPFTPGAFQQQLNGTSDAFVSCFEQPDIRKWITFYGGTESQNQTHNHQIEAGYAIKWRESDNSVYVVGRTSSADFPLELSSGYFNNAFENDEGTRGFILKFRSIDGGRLWNTFFGDSKKKYDGAIALLIRHNGNVAVGGYSLEYFNEESSFPFFPNNTPGLSPHIQTWGGMYIAEFNGDNNQQVWATKLGNDLAGAYGAGGVVNTVNDIDEDADGNLLVLGTMFEDALPNEPTGNDFLPMGTNSMPFSTLQFGHGCEACFFVFDPSEEILWSTYLGGWSNEYANSIICDKYGSIVVTGTTISDDFPAIAVGDPSDPLLNDLSLGGDSDMFMAKFVKIENDVYTMTWARYIGGPGYDRQSLIYFTSDNDAFSGSGNAAAEGGDGDILLTGAAENEFSPIEGLNGCTFYYPEINRGMIDFGWDAAIMVVGSDQRVNFSTYWGGDILGVLSFDEGTTISHGISSSDRPFLIVGGRTNSRSSSITIPVCHESPIPLPYYNADFLGGTLDAFISKIYYGECLTSGVSSPWGEIFGLDILPNPASEAILIKLPEIGKDGVSILLFDATGKAVSSLSQPSYSVTEEAISVQIGSLPSGLYYVTLQSSGRTYSGKFVKM